MSKSSQLRNREVEQSRRTTLHVMLLGIAITIVVTAVAMALLAVR